MVSGLGVSGVSLSPLGLGPIPFTEGEILGALLREVLALLPGQRNWPEVRSSLCVILAFPASCVDVHEDTGAWGVVGLGPSLLEEDARGRAVGR